LPDGRVLSAGGGEPATWPDGGNNANAQVYSPPYLFKGARPSITSAPKAVKYGQKFTVKTATASRIKKVTWIRLSSVTHSFNTTQRINYLSFSQAAGGLTVTAPANGKLAPPGHYLLFILNELGVPSRAEIVQIQ
jgi:hypothetical protein